MAPTCCAVDCVHNGKNSTCKLRTFPADPVRARQWENNIRRDRWERKSWHVICTCHFDESQWDQRQDGPKLKPNAQPLVFETHLIAGHGQPLKRRKHRQYLSVDPQVVEAVPAAPDPGHCPNPNLDQAEAMQTQEQHEVVQVQSETGGNVRYCYQLPYKKHLQ